MWLKYYKTSWLGSFNVRIISTLPVLLKFYLPVSQTAKSISLKLSVMTFFLCCRWVHDGLLVHLTPDRVVHAKLKKLTPVRTTTLFINEYKRILLIDFGQWLNKNDFLDKVLQDSHVHNPKLLFMRPSKGFERQATLRQNVATICC